MRDTKVLGVNVNPPKGWIPIQYSADSDDWDYTDVLEAAVRNGGHVYLYSMSGVPCTVKLTRALSFPSYITFEVGNNVNLDTTGLTTNCITATSKSNVRICGDGKIVCAAASVPSFTNCTNVEISVVIGEGDIDGAVFVVSPSGDSTGAIDRSSTQAAISNASHSGGVVHFNAGAYIFDYAVNLASGVHVTFDHGVTITLRDSLTKSCSYTTSTTVSGIDTTGLYAGMLVSDPAADLQANDAFGDIPYNTRISSVGSTSVVLTAAPTGSGSSLVFHPTAFLFKAIDISDWSMTCLNGWATLDGNYTHAYPYPTSDGRGDSCIRITGTVDDYTIDGIQCQNAYYHGLIGVGKVSNGRHPRYRGVGNGFRAIHYHSEGISGDSTPELKGNWFGRVETDGNGHRAFYTITSALNSGVFCIFSNTLNTQFDSVVARNERGIGFHVIGTTAASAYDPSYVSKYAQVGNLIAENCGVGLYIGNQAEYISVSNFTGWGKVLRLAGCATLAASSATRYYVNESGTVASIKVKAIQCPVGSVSAYGLREGLRVCASFSATGIPTDGVKVWEVEEGAGAGGTDLVWVYDDDSTSSDPYTTADADEVVSFYWAADKGLQLYDGSGDITRHIKLGNVSLENFARHGIYSQYSSSQFRFRDINIDSLTISGSRITGEVGSIDGLRIGKLAHKNAGSLTNTGTQSGSADLFFYNCSNFEIGLTSYEHTAGNTTNNERIRFDADCRNGHVGPLRLSLPASGDTINVLTTSGAGANTAGVSGPVILVDPKGADGTLLTVTGGYITRTAANACIIWRPSDAGDSG